MKLRTLTALPLAAMVIWLIGWGPMWAYLLAVLLTVEIGLHEFFNIGQHSGFKAFPIVGYIVSAWICLAQVTERAVPRGYELAFIVAVALLTFLLALFTPDRKQYLGGVCVTLLGIIYVGCTLAWLLPLRFSDPEPGRKRVFLLFLVIWAGDVCAYLAGQSFGRTRLAPRISPNKTIEGAVSGLAGSLLAAWGFAHWFWQTADMKTVILSAGLIALAGQAGDLVESALKRGADLKDSGTLLPGHGGLLDRIDSVIFGVPTLWWLVNMKGLLR
jgi:phosphatidate cytidylyltransferase